MTTVSLIHDLIILCAAGVFLWAAWCDLRAFRIPNHAVVALAVLYAAHAATAAAPVAWGMALGLAAFVFVVGCGLFAMRAMGGGDVKLLTAAILWAGTAHAFEFLLVTTGAGVLLAFAYALRAAADSARASGSGVVGTAMALRYVPVAKLMIPYGVAIAAGGLYVTAHLALAP